MFFLESEDIFRANDIRGIYPDTLNERVAEDMGLAFGTFLGKNKEIALSMDIRKSSPVLKRYFLKGLVKAGIKVRYIGTAPTPVLYFAVAHYGLDGGAAVSASHNPKEWNGLKLCGPKGRTYGMGFGLEKIKKIYTEKKFSYRDGGSMADWSKKLADDYQKFVIKKAGKLQGRKLKIGIDPGNGIDSVFAARFLAKAGLSTTAINNVPDGNFPSRSPEPKPDNITELRNLVKRKRLDFGVAFDGDGDRAMFVDDKGNAFFGDTILALMIKNNIKKGEKVVYELSSSKAVEDMIRLKGAKGIRAKTGRAFIIDKMIKNNAKLGGEHSTHFYFNEIYGFDDAIFATMKVAQLIGNRGRRMSELIKELPEYKKIASEFDVDDSRKFEIVENMAKGLKGMRNARIMTMEGVKVITNDGWFIARASNTTPKVKIVAEAEDEKNLKKIYAMAVSEFKKANARRK